MDAPQASLNMAHRFYALYETLPDNVQREFLAELWQKKHQVFEDLQFYLECKQAKDENEFLNEEETQTFIRCDANVIIWHRRPSNLFYSS